MPVLSFELIFKIIKLINILFMIFVLVFERKESSRRLAWLFILSAAPGFGIVFYLLFSGHFFTGSYRMKRNRKYVSNILKPVIEYQSQFIDSRKDKIKNDVLREYCSLAEMNLTKAESVLTFTNSTNVFTCGEDFFESLVNDLRQAKKSISMEYFIIRKDKIGKRIMHILCKKAREGVDVRLLYDDLGSLFTPSHFFKQLNAAGGYAKAWFPIRLGLPLTVNFRLHRKITVIDSKIAYTGGANIGDEYAVWRKKWMNWRDTVVKFTGSSVYNMQMIFFMDWYGTDSWYKKSHSIEEVQQYFPESIFNELNSRFITTDADSGKIPTQVLISGPDSKRQIRIEDMLIRIITRAKSYVYIQTPYFTPTEQFASALKIAASSGVDVRIMIPGKWDKFYVKAAAMDFLRQMMHHNVKFFVYPGFIHSKTLVCDDKLCSIGTTNIDNRSFALHFEDNVLFYDSDFTLKNKNIFEEDQEKCFQTHLEAFDKSPIFFRAWWSFWKIFSPLL